MTSPPVTPSNCTIKMSRDPSLLIPEMFIHTCGFISSISDLLNFREALGERDLVIPVKSESTATPPESKRHSTMDYSTKVSQFQQVAEETVLAHWPSLKPLQKTMENKARWLNIGSSLELREQTEKNIVWNSIVQCKREKLHDEVSELNSALCREYCDLICDTISCEDIQSCSVCGVDVIYVNAKFLHPIRGQWISYECSQAEEQEYCTLYYEFDTLTALGDEHKEKVEFCVPYVGDHPEQETRRLWEYLTATDSKDSSSCEATDVEKTESTEVDASLEEREMVDDWSHLWAVFQSPLDCFFLYIVSDAEMRIELSMCSDEVDFLQDEDDDQEVEELLDEVEEYFHFLIVEHPDQDEEDEDEG